MPDTREKVYVSSTQGCKALGLRMCWTIPNPSISTSVVLGFQRGLRQPDFSVIIHFL